MQYDVNIRRGGHEALVDLQGEAGTIRDWVDEALPEFPATPNTATRLGERSLYWIAPERWLLRAPLADEDNLLALTRPQLAPLEISIVLVSDTLVFFHVDGADAADIVAIACPLDTHPSVFPENGAGYTEIFGIKGLLIRREDGFDIAVESSYADMLADYLQRAIA